MVLPPPTRSMEFFSKSNGILFQPFRWSLLNKATESLIKETECCGSALVTDKKGQILLAHYFASVFLIVNKSSECFPNCPNLYQFTKTHSRSFNECKENIVRSIIMDSR